jgi:F420-non-reducing hydrogenase iron-sulfur subunit
MTESSIRIIGFCCKNAIESDPVLAEKGWHAFEPEIKILSVPCSSKVETLSIIKAFESGADGVFVVGCRENACRLLNGNQRAQRTIDYTKNLLDEINIETNRLSMIQMGTPEFKDLNHVVRYVTGLIQNIGKIS